MLVFSTYGISQVNAKEVTIDGEKNVSTVGANAGTCGENLTWDLSSEGTLTISGIGDMQNYSENNLAPWDKKKVQRIVIQEGVTSIGDMAFISSDKLTTVELPDGLLRIGKKAFYACTRLNTINFPEGLKTIEEAAFKSCIKLPEVDLSEGLLVIGDEAFGFCALANVNFPKSLTDIGERAFESCSNLTAIALPEGLRTIGNEAFFECRNLAQISVDEKNNYYCSVDGVLYDKTRTKIICYPSKKEGTTFEIPSSVTSIADGAFCNCRNLTNIQVPNGVTSLGNDVFYGCTNLTDIKLPDGITSVGDNTFSQCVNLIELVLPKEVKSIGNFAFYSCFRMKKIEMPKGIVSVHEDAFIDCDEQILVLRCYSDSVAHLFAVKKNLKYELITEVDVPTENPENKPGNQPTEDSENKPGNQPTENPNIKYLSSAKVKLSSKVYEYDGTPKEPDVTVILAGKTLTEDVDYVVSYASNIEIGTGIVTITGTGNYGGTIIKLFTISKKKDMDVRKATVTLYKYSYYYDGKVKKPPVVVKLNGKLLKENKDYTVKYKNNKNIGTATVTIKGKENYTGTISKTFKIIMKKGTRYTIGACRYKVTSETTVVVTGLKSDKSTKLTVPKTIKIGGKTFKVTAIAEKAFFKNINITHITIGKNIISIGAEAFKGCKNLSSITIQSEKLKTIGKNVFKDINSNAELKVPTKALEAYKKLFHNKGQSKKVKITPF